MPLYARCIGGATADRFCEALGDTMRERLRRYLIAHSPAADEYHFWLRDDASGEVQTLFCTCKNKN